MKAIETIPGNVKTQAGKWMSKGLIKGGKAAMAIAVGAEERRKYLVGDYEGIGSDIIKLGLMADGGRATKYEYVNERPEMMIKRTLPSGEIVYEQPITTARIGYPERPLIETNPVYIRRYPEPFSPDTTISERQALIESGRTIGNRQGQLDIKSIREERFPFRDVTPEEIAAAGTQMKLIPEQSIENLPYMREMGDLRIRGSYKLKEQPKNWEYIPTKETKLTITKGKDNVFIPAKRTMSKAEIARFKTAKQDIYLQNQIEHSKLMGNDNYRELLYKAITENEAKRNEELEILARQAMIEQMPKGYFKEIVEKTPVQTEEIKYVSKYEPTTAESERMQFEVDRGREIGDYMNKVKRENYLDEKYWDREYEGRRGRYGRKRGELEPNYGGKEPEMFAEPSYPKTELGGSRFEAIGRVGIRPKVGTGDNVIIRPTTETSTIQDVAQKQIQEIEQIPRQRIDIIPISRLQEMPYIRLDQKQIKTTPYEETTPVGS